MNIFFPGFFEKFDQHARNFLFQDVVGWGAGQLHLRHPRGAGLGPLADNVWRIGLMDYASNRKNVLFCLGALEAVFNRSGGVAEARAYYSTL